MTEFVMTPHRTKILSVLLEQGEIVDQEGQATTLLMEETGHRTTNALSGVLLSMEQAGLIERDKAGRRTYRIALTREGRRVAQSLNRMVQSLNGKEAAAEAPQSDPEVTAAVVDGSVDLDLLAGVLLKKALVATQATEQQVELRERMRRFEERAVAAEERADRAEAELKALRSRMAELEAENKTLVHNNQLLIGQMDRVKNNPGQPISKLISKRERLELDKLMRAIPTSRG